MSRGARLTILGLYEYNEDIFAGFDVPAGMDRETALNEILLQCGDLELIYPTYNILKLAITNWTRIEMPIWEKLYNTENFDYNPIWNVDGKVVETGSREESGSRNNKLIRSGSSQETSTGTLNETGTNDETITTNSTNTGSTKGYNESSWLDNQKNVVSGSEVHDAEHELNQSSRGTVTGSTSGTDTETGSNSLTSDDTRETIRTGNIGVTTTQQMIREERDVDTFSTVKYIVDSFKKRFCILIY